MNGTDLSRPRKQNSLLTVGKSEMLSLCKISKRFRNWHFQVCVEMGLKIELKIG